METTEANSSRELSQSASRCYSRPVSKDGHLLEGEPLQVVTASNENGRTMFKLDIEKLEKILLHSAVRSRHVVVVSVAGAFRQGKSFLLNFLLRYLDAQGSNDWVGANESPLEGFSWRGGSERDTTGILMWSEPYIRTLPNGDEVAVLLMDTQGAFDSQSTVRECATVFALSTMLSSIQVYNIIGNVQEDHLQHLHLFTDYGLLAMEKGVGTPFQHLHFLVRDWSYPYEYAYGAAGGDKLIAKRLQPESSQPKELQNVRQHLWSCFQQIHCFLLPHPGLSVASNPHFDGRISDIEPKFLECVQQLAPLLLHEKNLVVKQINDQTICGRDLLHYFKSYIDVYQCDELPEPKTVWQATAEANNLAALASAKDFYCKEMDKICGSDCSYTDAQIVERADERFRREALKHFADARKMGGEHFSKPYYEQLETQLLSLGEQYRQNNSAKNVFSGARAPIILLGAAFVDYILWGIAAFVGIGPLETIFQLLLASLIVGLVLWTYSRFTGQYRVMADKVELMASAIYTNVYLPISRKLASHQTSVISAAVGGNSSSNSHNLTSLGSSNRRVSANISPSTSSVHSKRD